ncbi:uncharacterized protein [Dysidea avara]|uniref:uncharacterized protein isoform X2 n=1 Tax=Dysidea avara TaxID=196820 RepID=UPI0033227DD4
MTAVLGVSPIYLASYEAVNVTGILTILRLGFQLACGLEDVAMCVVNIRNINVSFPVSSISHEITNDTDNRSNSFNPTKVFLNFPNISMGTDYFIRARLLNSEGTLIGPEHQRIINVGVPRSSESATPVMSTSAIVVSSSTTGISRSTAGMSTSMMKTQLMATQATDKCPSDSHSLSTGAAVALSCSLTFLLSVTTTAIITFIITYMFVKKRKVQECTVKSFTNRELDPAYSRGQRLELHQNPDHGANKNVVAAENDPAYEGHNY